MSGGGLGDETASAAVLDARTLVADARTLVIAAGDVSSAATVVTATQVTAHSSALGESPLWDVRTETFFWVDIVSGELLARDVHGTVTAVLTGRTDISLVRVVAGSSNGVLLIAEQAGVSLVNPASDGAERRYGRPASMEPQLRFNDGECDSAGRLWVGTLDDDGVVPGRLYSMNARGDFVERLAGLECPNGLGWSGDDTTAYLVESVSRRILAADFDAPTGVMSHWRVAVQFAPDGPMPDGLTMTADGGMWIAFWGGSCLVLLDAALAIVARVDVPTELVTAVTAAGDGLTEMLVTTAALTSFDHAAGVVYGFTSPVAGAPAGQFAL